MHSRTAAKTPLWDKFWLLLGLGLAARLFIAVFTDWAMRPDETIQYLEQAHRLVFGYGFIPWEYRFGVRTWLLPIIPALPLWISKILGIDTPAVYIPLVNAYNALLSMAIPLGMYFYTRRAVSETAARWALGFGCFWYEFLAFAPHALAESYAAALFMAALAVGYGSQQRRQLLCGGLLLGLAFAARVPYAPLVAVYGLFWLATLPRNRWPYPLLGGVGGLLIWGAVDYFTWGGWWASIFNYYEIFQILATGVKYPPYINIVATLKTSCGLYAVITLFAVCRWRNYLPLLLMLATVTAVHSNPANQEYTNMFVAFPLLWMLAGGLMDNSAQRMSRRSRIAVCGIVAAVSCLGLAGKLPFDHKKIFNNDNRPLVFVTIPQFEITGMARQAMADEPVDAILWEVAGNVAVMGGYYHLHRNVPVYFPHNPYHVKIMKDSGLPAQKLFSHILSTAAQLSPHFTSVPLPPSVFLHRNNTAGDVVPLPNYVYNMHSGFLMTMIVRKAQVLGTPLIPQKPLIPFRP